MILYNSVVKLSAVYCTNSITHQQGELPARHHAQHPGEEGRGQQERRSGNGQRQQRRRRAIPQRIEGGRGGDGEGAEKAERGNVGQSRTNLGQNVQKLP